MLLVKSQRFLLRFLSNWITKWYTFSVLSVLFWPHTGSDIRITARARANLSLTPKLLIPANNGLNKFYGTCSENYKSNLRRRERLNFSSTSPINTPLFYWGPQIRPWACRKINADSLIVIAKVEPSQDFVRESRGRWTFGIEFKRKGKVTEYKIRCLSWTHCICTKIE